MRVLAGTRVIAIDRENKELELDASLRVRFITTSRTFARFLRAGHRVSEYLRTGDPAIHAVGDVAEVRGAQMCRGARPRPNRR